MTRMFVRHAVVDFNRWKKAYDEFSPVRTSLGVRAQAVFQAVDNPTDVTVTHDFDTPAAARAFMESRELRDTMQAAGVSASPTVWFTTPV